MSSTLARFAMAAVVLAGVSTAAVAQTATSTPPAGTDPAVTAPATTDPAAAPAVDAAAPVDPAVGAAAPAEGEEAAAAPIENPYGLQALWAQGDFVAKGILVILVLMSIGTWYIMVVKLIEQSILLRQANAADRDFWTAASISDGAMKLKKNSAFRMLVEDGLRAAEHHEGTLTEQIDLHTWVTMSLQRSAESISNRLKGGLAFLATVGSTAPFVGLLGTVWGIYHALVSIGVSGQASIDKVAGPVGEALIMTAIGLGVAVPAVLGYNWLISRNKVVNDRVRNFSADLHALLVGGSRVKQARSA